MNVSQYAKHTGRSKQLISKWLKPGGLLYDVHTRVNGRIFIDVKKADYLIKTGLDLTKSRRVQSVSGMNSRLPDFNDIDYSELERMGRELDEIIKIIGPQLDEIIKAISKDFPDITSEK
jgi:hypothetical protein